jgi:hypothetical protein
MKNLVKLLGVIAIAAVIGFSFAACPEPEEEGGPTTYGDKLELSDEQVYVIERSEDNYFTINYKPYTGADVTFDSVYGATPKIVGGKFSFSVGVPTSLEDIDGWFSYEDMFTDIEISDTTVKVASIYRFEYSTTTYYDDYTSESVGSMRRENVEYNSKSYTSESAEFVYVDKPVKITAKGKTGTSDFDGYKYTWKSNDLNLSLSAGWNTVCYKDTDSASGMTFTISVSNPSSLKWVF